MALFLISASGAADPIWMTECTVSISPRCHDLIIDHSLGTGYLMTVCINTDRLMAIALVAVSIFIGSRHSEGGSNKKQG